MPRASKPPASHSSVLTALRGAVLPAALVTGMALLIAYAVLGPNGVLALGDYRQQVAQRERVYQALDTRRQMLSNRVALLDPRHANPDMVDELVRKELNVAHPDEVIVPLK